VALAQLLFKALTFMVNSKKISKVQDPIHCFDHLPEKEVVQLCSAAVT